MPDHFAISFILSAKALDEKMRIKKYKEEILRYAQNNR